MTLFRQLDNLYSDYSHNRQAKTYLERTGTAILRLGEHVVAGAVELVLFAVKGGVVRLADGRAHRGAGIGLTDPSSSLARAARRELYG